MQYFKNYIPIILFVFSLGFLPLTSTSQTDSSDQSLSYLALGDSYTIGESVKVENQWPRQLKNALDTSGYSIDEPTIIAKTGWRTDDMLKAARSQLNKEKFDLVSLLIGVNNEYQGKTPESFKKEFETCLKYAINKSKNGKKGVFVLSIPDYGYTPFGAKKQKQKQISERIDAYNAICKRICQEYNVLYINVTDISRNVKKDNSLVADDGLHPSAEQYHLWVERAFDRVSRMITLL